MTEDQAWRIIDNLKNWNKTQTAASPEMQPMIDAKRNALTEAYNTLSQLNVPGEKK